MDSLTNTFSCYSYSGRHQVLNTYLFYWRVISLIMFCHDNDINIKSNKKLYKDLLGKHNFIYVNILINIEA